MGLHVLPIIAVLIYLFIQSYNFGYYKNVKDQLYGGETLLPSFVIVILLAMYYGAYFFFTFIK